ncbi:MAG: hypothetical protein JW969_18015 [Spirochaetales bacterium]|nr:hypothetical protein [Spirochaetales bacterium]
MSKRIYIITVCIIIFFTAVSLYGEKTFTIKKPVSPEWQTGKKYDLTLINDISFVLDGSKITEETRLELEISILKQTAEKTFETEFLLKSVEYKYKVGSRKIIDYDSGSSYSGIQKVPAERIDLYFTYCMLDLVFKATLKNNQITEITYDESYQKKIMELLNTKAEDTEDKMILERRQFAQGVFNTAINGLNQEGDTEVDLLEKQTWGKEINKHIFGTSVPMKVKYTYVETFAGIKTDKIKLEITGKKKSTNVQVSNLPCTLNQFTGTGTMSYYYKNNIFSHIRLELSCPGILKDDKGKTYNVDFEILFVTNLDMK